MDTLEVRLQPSSIPEWEAEDLMAGRLASDTVLANDEQARAMLEKMRLGLPVAILQAELIGYADQRKTPLSLAMPTDGALYDFYLIEIPLSILVPENQHLVRLRLRLDLPSVQHVTEPIVAYDLFPTDHSEEKLTSIGEISLDVSKALTFICPAPIANSLGFQLKLPIQWKSEYIFIRTTNRMSNPVEWYVTDRAIRDGFIAYAIIRAPKKTPVTVEASLACELRMPGPFGRFFQARYASDKHFYRL